jgi:hypothetical protein
VNSGLIGRTGQLRKIIFGLTLLVFGMSLLFWILSDSPPQKESLKGALIYFGALTGLIGVFLPVATVRCPNCRDRWLWRAMSRKDDSEWLKWLIALDACPKCDTKL